MGWKETTHYFDKDTFLLMFLIAPNVRPLLHEYSFIRNSIILWCLRLLAYGHHRDLVSNIFYIKMYTCAKLKNTSLPFRFIKSGISLVVSSISDFTHLHLLRKNIAWWRRISLEVSCTSNLLKFWKLQNWNFLLFASETIHLSIKRFIFCFNIVFRI